jgi:hypothetical protein
LIQISSPTQGPSHPQNTGILAEGSVVEGLPVGNTDGISDGISDGSSASSSAQTKNGSSIFARLLEGLSVKLTKEAAGEPEAGSDNKITQSLFGK